jgi:hypothetical protein
MYQSLTDNHKLQQIIIKALIAYDWLKLNTFTNLFILANGHFLNSQW